MRALLEGPPPVLPVWVDALARRWAGVPPRARTVVIGLAVLLVLAGTEVRVRRAESRWGGAPVTAWVAETDTGVGQVPQLRQVRLPPGALPAAPADEPDAATPLTLALPEGAVLTALHVSPTGPAVGLPEGSRLVPIPVDAGWGVVAGGRVDVWLADTSGATALVAARRPVLEVRGEEPDRLTALVAVEEDDVTAVAGGLGTGSVLLSHAPP